MHLANQQRNKHRRKEIYMKRTLFLLAAILILLMVYGCDKEKIVTNTEIVKETEYIQSDPDTKTL